jgi:hypothetical protein
MRLASRTADQTKALAGALYRLDALLAFALMRWPRNARGISAAEMVTGQGENGGVYDDGEPKKGFYFLETASCSMN